MSVAVQPPGQEKVVMNQYSIRLTRAERQLRPGKNCPPETWLITNP
jgi:hypothetical protein